MTNCFTLHCAGGWKDSKYNLTFFILISAFFIDLFIISEDPEALIIALDETQYILSLYFPLLHSFWIASFLSRAGLVGTFNLLPSRRSWRLHATRGRGFGMGAWSCGFSRSSGRGWASCLRAGDFDWLSWRYNSLRCGGRLDFWHLVTMLVDTDNDIDCLATISVLHTHGELARIFHGHALNGEAGKFSRVQWDHILVTWLNLLVKPIPGDMRFGVTTHCAGETQGLQETKNRTNEINSRGTKKCS